MSNNLYVYEIGNDYFIAASLLDAFTVRREYYANNVGYDDAEMAELDVEGRWDRRESDDILGVLLDANGDVTGSGEPTHIKTCGEWARERGRGFLCTSEF